MHILEYVNVDYLIIDNNIDNKIRKYNSENVRRIKAAGRFVANR